MRSAATGHQLGLLAPFVPDSICPTAQEKTVWIGVGKRIFGWNGPLVPVDSDIIALANAGTAEHSTHLKTVQDEESEDGLTFDNHLWTVQAELVQAIMDLIPLRGPLPEDTHRFRSFMVLCMLQTVGTINYSVAETGPGCRDLAVPGENDPAPDDGEQDEWEDRNRKMGTPRMARMLQILFDNARQEQVLLIKDEGEFSDEEYDEEDEAEAEAAPEEPLPSAAPGEAPSSTTTPQEPLSSTPPQEPLPSTTPEKQPSTATPTEQQETATPPPPPPAPATLTIAEAIAQASVTTAEDADDIDRSFPVHGQVTELTTRIPIEAMEIWYFLGTVNPLKLATKFRPVVDVVTAQAMARFGAPVPVPAPAPDTNHRDTHTNTVLKDVRDLSVPGLEDPLVPTQVALLAWQLIAQFPLMWAQVGRLIDVEQVPAVVEEEKEGDAVADTTAAAAAAPPAQSTADAATAAVAKLAIHPTIPPRPRRTKSTAIGKSVMTSPVKASKRVPTLPTATATAETAETAETAPPTEPTKPAEPTDDDDDDDAPLPVAPPVPKITVKSIKSSSFPIGAALLERVLEKDDSDRLDFDSFIGDVEKTEEKAPSSKKGGNWWWSGLGIGKAKKPQPTLLNCTVRKAIPSPMLELFKVYPDLMKNAEPLRSVITHHLVKNAVEKEAWAARLLFGLDMLVRQSGIEIRVDPIVGDIPEDA